ncbi:hypothetical protein Hz2V102 [Helicoverpa zea nudivirus 2]|uniref:Uncharacterized protein n=1 Tax=Helicoverpa zea nudivirus 2 TaxID=1128424 RepID=G9I0C8_HZNV2|nr:orf102 gene product [Helicoverpa zea nudivirus 2]AEW69652.1 hypothetical protein Hz2V102 [Helicoverpa zea nudivirus 2]WCZ68579.1 hypothetical protein HvNV102 [Heliothis virescens nudivirus]
MDHDSLYLEFINKTIGPYGVALHSYFVGIVGIMTVIVIMISCLTQRSVRCKRTIPKDRKVYVTSGNSVY